MGGMVRLSHPVIACASPTANQRKGTIEASTVPLPWRRTIFCQFEHEQLKEAIERCARETDCRVFHGESGSPDIFAIGSFISIVDRNVVGHDLWQEYVECFDPVMDDTPCFIIDDLMHLPLPRRNYVYQFDMTDKRSIMTIVKMIRQMRREMDRRLPDLFKTL